jgi:hypothetical protein
MTRETREITEQVTKAEVVSITCDFCNRVFKKGIRLLDGLPVGEITVMFQYGSRHDLNKYTGDICDDCFDKLFGDKKLVREDMIQ